LVLQKTVGLLDLDIDGSNIPKVLNMPLQEPTVSKHWVEPLDFHGVKVMSMANMMLNDDIPVLLRGEQKRKWIGDFLKGINWDEPDFLIVDMPPAAGDAAVMILETIGANLHGVIIVTTPSRIAITDARKTAGLCAKFGLRVIGLVNNMSVSTCPSCHNTYALFGRSVEDGRRFRHPHMCQRSCRC
jgi:ATP-binding protein involved in chromosome partitioning